MLAGRDVSPQPARTGAEQTMECGGPPLPRASAGQARRDHFGVVEHEKIARMQQSWQIRNTAVVERAGYGNHQQPRRIARFARLKRDPFSRQVEIEIVDVHNY